MDHSSSQPAQRLPLDASHPPKPSTIVSTTNKTSTPHHLAVNCSPALSIFTTASTIAPTTIPQTASASQQNTSLLRTAQLTTSLSNHTPISNSVQSTSGGVNGTISSHLNPPPSLAHHKSVTQNIAHFLPEHRHFKPLPSAPATLSVRFGTSADAPHITQIINAAYEKAEGELWETTFTRTRVENTASITAHDPYNAHRGFLVLEDASIPDQNKIVAVLALNWDVSLTLSGQSLSSQKPTSIEQGSVILHHQELSEMLFHHISYHHNNNNNFSTNGSNPRERDSIARIGSLNWLMAFYPTPQSLQNYTVETNIPNRHANASNIDTTTTTTAAPSSSSSSSQMFPSLFTGMQFVSNQNGSRGGNGGAQQQQQQQQHVATDSNPAPAAAPCLEVSRTESKTSISISPEDTTISSNQLPPLAQLAGQPVGLEQSSPNRESIDDESSLNQPQQLFNPTQLYPGAAKSQYSRLTNHSIVETSSVSSQCYDILPFSQTVSSIPSEALLTPSSSHHNIQMLQSLPMNAIAGSIDNELSFLTQPSLQNHATTDSLPQHEHTGEPSLLRLQDMESQSSTASITTDAVAPVPTTAMVFPPKILPLQHNTSSLTSFTPQLFQSTSSIDPDRYSLSNHHSNSASFYLNQHQLQSSQQQLSTHHQSHITSHLKLEVIGHFGQFACSLHHRGNRYGQRLLWTAQSFLAKAAAYYIDILSFCASTLSSSSSPLRHNARLTKMISPIVLQYLQSSYTKPIVPRVSMCMFVLSVRETLQLMYQKLGFRITGEHSDVEFEAVRFQLKEEYRAITSLISFERAIKLDQQQ